MRVLDCSLLRLIQTNREQHVCIDWFVIRWLMVKNPADACSDKANYKTAFLILYCKFYYLVPESRMCYFFHTATFLITHLLQVGHKSTQPKRVIQIPCNCVAFGSLRWQTTQLLRRRNQTYHFLFYNCIKHTMGFYGIFFRNYCILLGSVLKENDFS